MIISLITQERNTIKGVVSVIEELRVINKHKLSGKFLKQN